MKTLTITDRSGMHVELLTDLIGENKEFTVYQVSEIVNGKRQIGLSDATIAKGLSFDIDEYNLENVVADCIDNNYTLTIYETGRIPEIIIYYGDAIGGNAI